MNEAERIIAILVDRLGGEVEISCAELEGTPLQLVAGKHSGALSYLFRARPAVIDEYLEVTDRVSAEMMATALREIEA